MENVFTRKETQQLLVAASKKLEASSNKKDQVCNSIKCGLKVPSSSFHYDGTLPDV